MAVFSKKNFLGLLFVSPFTFADIPAECLELYIGSGAIPAGPGASFQELLSCKLTATSPLVNMGNRYCVGSGASEWVSEYCGTQCSNYEDLARCFNNEPDFAFHLGFQCLTVGNPIHIGSGNKFQEESDYIEKAEYPLRVDRYYNSELGTWRFTGQESLEVTPTTIRWIRDDGKAISFTFSNQTWLSSDIPGARLTETETQLILYLSGVKRIFNLSGQLLKASFKNGMFHNYSYFSNGQLKSIISTKGRGITFSYNNIGQISEIITPENFAITYTYENENLRSVTKFETLIKEYHYEDPRFPDALTGITDERGVRYVTWKYNKDKKAVSSENHLSNGLESVNKFTLNYSIIGQIEVTNPLGKTTKYTFEKINGQDKIKKVEGVASENCLAANQHYTYYPNGQVETKTDWKGVVTRFEYNDRHLESKRIEAAGTPEQRVITTTWHPELNLPATVKVGNQVTTYHYSATGQLENKTIKSL
ncbi:DUF6531 domain-containing protein [Motilimonas cestriensis]|uniref:DUF6531 domain-containing protein n=1 Tax=Motilimonas cestriensis TaxID=2742685 RepID=UPI003DA23054